MPGEHPPRPTHRHQTSTALTEWPVVRKNTLTVTRCHAPVPFSDYGSRIASPTIRRNVFCSSAVISSSP